MSRGWGKTERGSTQASKEFSRDTAVCRGRGQNLPTHKFGNNKHNLKKKKVWRKKSTDLKGHREGKQKNIYEETNASLKIEQKTISILERQDEDIKDLPDKA